MSLEGEKYHSWEDIPGSYTCLGVICGELEGVGAKCYDVRQQAGIGNDVPRESQCHIAVGPENK